MTSDVWTNLDVPRRFASHTAHRWFNARHTCSSVTSGFFPPQPIRLAGHEAQHHQTQHQVTHHPRVVAPS